MTIFDTLRYSNIDISNEDELQRLPRPLLEAWAKEITKDLPGGVGIDWWHPLISFSDSAVMWAQCFAQKSRPWGASKTNMTQHLFEDIYKEQFTVLLKKMIAEYDTEISISNL